MDKLIGELHKNPVEKLQVRLRAFKGHPFVDLRLYFQDEAGEWCPAKKGITVSPALWPDFLELLAKVEAQLPTPAPLKAGR